MKTGYTENSTKYTLTLNSCNNKEENFKVEAKVFYQLINKKNFLGHNLIMQNQQKVSATDLNYI